MMRGLALSLGVGLGIASTAVCCRSQSIPVAYDGPVTLRVLSGLDGVPMANLHMVLYGGYDGQEIRGQDWREEVLTDEKGEARLSKQAINLPFIQAWPVSTAKKKMMGLMGGGMQTCQDNPRKDKFSMERILRDGLSTPNRCGIIQAENEPGVFTVYVRDRKITKDKKADQKSGKKADKENSDESEE